MLVGMRLRSPVVDSDQHPILALAQARIAQVSILFPRVIVCVQYLCFDPDCSGIVTKTSQQAAGRTLTRCVGERRTVLGITARYGLAGATTQATKSYPASPPLSGVDWMVRASKIAALGCAF